MKKEFKIVLVIILMVGVFIGIFIWAYRKDMNKPNPLIECQNQCLKQNFTFYEYNYGGYQNPACLCKDEKGIIKTIYTR